MVYHELTISCLKCWASEVSQSLDFSRFWNIFTHTHTHIILGQNSGLNTKFICFIYTQYTVVWKLFHICRKTIWNIPLVTLFWCSKHLQVLKFQLYQDYGWILYKRLYLTDQFQDHNKTGQKEKTSLKIFFI